MGSAILNKSAILGAVDLQTELVEVPEWGGNVYVRGLNAAERDAFEASCLAGKGKSRDVNLANIRAKLCVLALVDDKGNRLFGDSDAAALGEKSGAVIDRIYDVAARLAGITEADADELAKNSESDQSDDSISD